MQIYVPATYRAALMALRRGTDADIERIDAIDAKHLAIATRLYNGIMDGTITEAHQYHCAGHGLIVYHRSTRGNHVQVSSFYRDTDGDWDAQGHKDVFSPKDITLQPATRLTIAA